MPKRVILGLLFAVQFMRGAPTVHPTVLASLVISLFTLASPIAAHAQGAAQESSDIGKHEYRVTRGVCHGDKGKGDGPYSGWLKKQPSDLSTLQRNNFGVFPFNCVYEIIDGREAVAAHGTREMPIWGDIYSGDAGRQLFGFATPKDLESYTRGQIIALVGYVYSLQEK